MESLAKEATEFFPAVSVRDIVFHEIIGTVREILSNTSLMRQKFVHINAFCVPQGRAPRALPECHCLSSRSASRERSSTFRLRGGRNAR